MAIVLANRVPHERPGEEPLSRLAPAAAHDSALILGRAGRHEASLPYWRRALHGRADVSWEMHYNYAVALANTGFEIRERYGVPTPATRSSIERVAWMRAALAHLDTAERMAPTAAGRAAVIRMRAGRLQLWGLPWDAAVQMRRAREADPSQPDLARGADEYLGLMRDPVRPAHGDGAR
jgi:hypothetical protein